MEFEFTTTWNNLKKNPTFLPFNNEWVLVILVNEKGQYTNIEFARFESITCAKRNVYVFNVQYSGINKQEDYYFNGEEWLINDGEGHSKISHWIAIPPFPYDKDET